ncbi:FkbM family methyltransferase [Polynucleobacter paneuropaeus]|nr:FkbM family methyltransferase [Polynucleobacter paneuropaeus]
MKIMWIIKNLICRIGRRLYMFGRGDNANIMEKNGELFLQEQFLLELKLHENSDKKIIIFDVGANIGEWSIAMHTLAKKLNIDHRINLYQFEPVGSTFKNLKNNLQNLGIHSTVERLALSSEDGEAEIFISHENAGTNSLHKDSTNNSEVESILINKIDTYCKTHNLDRVNFIKCDAEGHDFEVIKGAYKMLESGAIDLLQFEYNHRWIFSGHSFKQVFDLIDGTSYLLAKIQPEYLLFFNEWHPELDRFFEGNYALVHKDMESRFPAKYADFDKSNVYRIR